MRGREGDGEREGGKEERREGKKKRLKKGYLPVPYTDIRKTHCIQLFQ